jgi:hypothetical protein
MLEVLACIWSKLSCLLMALACRKDLYRTIFLDDILNASYEAYLSTIQPYSIGPQLNITDYQATNAEQQKV